MRRHLPPKCRLKLVEGLAMRQDFSVKEYDALRGPSRPREEVREQRPELGLFRVQLGIAAEELFPKFGLPVQQIKFLLHKRRPELARFQVS